MIMITMIVSVISSGSLLLSSISVMKSVTAIRTVGLNVGHEDNSDLIRASNQKNLTNDYQNMSDFSVKVGPPSKGVYLGALTDFGGAEDEVTPQKIIDFEKLIGKKIVWAYFSNNWGSGIKFPENAVRAIHSVGVIPFIRMMPRTSFYRWCSISSLYSARLYRWKI